MAEKILRDNYVALCNVLKNEDTLLDHFVTENLINDSQAVDIRNEKLAAKGSTLLTHITGPVNSGYIDGFKIMLNIMKSHGKVDTQKHAERILHELQKAVGAKSTVDAKSNDCGKFYY